MSEQPMPQDGTGTPADAVLLDEFRLVLVRQTSKGARKYGQPVRAWNGRDAGQDAIEEWVDLGIYLTQLRLEHADLVVENARLGAENAMLKGAPTASEAAGARGQPMPKSEAEIRGLALFYLAQGVVLGAQASGLVITKEEVDEALRAGTEEKTGQDRVLELLARKREEQGVPRFSDPLP
jgi:hypothetical protein